MSSESKPRSYWADQTGDLRARLAASVPAEELKRLHRRRPLMHFLVLGWQFLLLFGGGAIAWRASEWWIWLPAALVVGFTVFNFTVMLHEVVHELVFGAGGHPGYRALRHLYAFPSGISATQFTRWHLDHHAQLGDAEADPKRHWLSPKRNARWFKALYLTPALIPIYFRAARNETASYPDEVRRAIARERRLTVAGHLAILAALIAAGGFFAAFKAYLVPVFLVFPVAFTVNRLGQHYDIEPGNPALWGSVLRPSRFWDVAFLWSAYHLEHHYFPRVPFYNLRALHFLLRPFFEEVGARPTSYGRLLWQWFVQNRAPHTDWRKPAESAV
ncbi:MAG: fatty acid desaturase [Acidobacteriota bacterium]|nr:fatty acid desaturase [Acidobacteriota bacterium]